MGDAKNKKISNQSIKLRKPRNQECPANFKINNDISDNNDDNNINKQMKILVTIIQIELRRDTGQKIPC